MIYTRQIDSDRRLLPVRPTSRLFYHPLAADITAIFFALFLYRWAVVGAKTTARQTKSRRQLAIVVALDGGARQ